MTSLDRVRIVLVEPAGARNVGSIARIMKNMGLTRLILVNPECDPLGTEARHMAVHAQDVLISAQVVDRLPEALQGCHRTIATVGRSAVRPVEPLRQVVPWLLGQDAIDPPTLPEAALIFGREDHGLSNEEVLYAQRLVTIPSSPDYQSLNLAQAVGICCYELYQGTIDPSSTPAPAQPKEFEIEDAAPFEAIEGFHQDLEAFLLQIGYLYPHTAASRMEKFRQLLHRAQTSQQEIAMLRGILRQTRWSLENTPNTDQIES